MLFRSGLCDQPPSSSQAGCTKLCVSTVTGEDPPAGRLDRPAAASSSAAASGRTGEHGPCPPPSPPGTAARAAGADSAPEPGPWAEPFDCGGGGGAGRGAVEEDRDRACDGPGSVGPAAAAASDPRRAAAAPTGSPCACAGSAPAGWKSAGSLRTGVKGRGTEDGGEGVEGVCSATAAAAGYCASESSGRGSTLPPRAESLSVALKGWVRCLAVCWIGIKQRRKSASGCVELYFKSKAKICSVPAPSCSVPLLCLGQSLSIPNGLAGVAYLAGSAWKPSDSRATCGPRLLSADKKTTHKHASPHLGLQCQQIAIPKLSWRESRARLGRRERAQERKLTRQALGPRKDINDASFRAKLWHRIRTDTMRYLTTRAWPVLRSRRPRLAWVLPLRSALTRTLSALTRSAPSLRRAPLLPYSRVRLDGLHASVWFHSGRLLGHRRLERDRLPLSFRESREPLRSCCQGSGAGGWSRRNKRKRARAEPRWPPLARRLLGPEAAGTRQVARGASPEAAAAAACSRAALRVFR